MTELLHVHRYGPPGSAQVLAIHGLTGHGQRWQTLATQHLSEFAVAAPDLLGHGRSSWAAPWTIEANVAALAGLLDGPVVVVGHSFGGAIALSLAAARPDLVSALVLLDPAVGLDGRWMRDIADDMFASPDYPDRAEARAEKVNGSWGEVDANELERELDEHLIDLPTGRCGWRISIPAMMAYWSELARPITLPSNGVPVTLVRAMKTDPPYVTDDLLTGIADRPDFTLIEFDCDHMVAQARPEETAGLIRERLN
ncbi:alpha/beta hydrolase [Mycolicibacterium celeriflavum]|uniref:Alpha/beta hydrolase n=1 Tax=Mycolicibacterium celeriflavum TaxID=1249101 RepID=A0A1X0BQJ8_MYCCF|nr:alpha/beta hydrolase [Mycolicibacterium celeriflavum]MCV7237917.1 alpha/beta hydrolase [Mycolicibacterium celeriflavum]OBG18925.1 alpha/beta hydrolase [Mycolicibacterium celeriflavum]ORA45614.1 alpha/beta hydrolase [Mycolicibacterium celeriflavum]BBY43672.1 alpha/beta hydrolase [Mycolicibacterium celeriflavum]